MNTQNMKKILSVFAIMMLCIISVSSVYVADVEAAGNESVLIVSTDLGVEGITITADPAKDGLSNITAETDASGKATFRLAATSLWYISGEEYQEKVSQLKTFTPVGGKSFKLTIEYVEKFVFTVNFNSANFNATNTSALTYADDLAGLSPVKNSTSGAHSVEAAGWDVSNALIKHCYYAVFAADGSMKGKLNPADLTKYDNGTSAANDIKNNNVMWCIPTIYVSTTATTLTLSNDCSTGVAYAHIKLVSFDGSFQPHIYEYYGVGVFEGTIKDEKLMSVSAATPTASTTRDVFRDKADNNTVVNGMASQWNFHQWQLYRCIVVSTMGTFDAQGTIGQGNVSGSGPTTTGSMNTSGMFYGDTSGKTSGVKAYIENSWGSLNEFLDDIVRDSSGNIWVGQNSTITNGTSSDKINMVNPSKAGYTDTISTNPMFWGMNTANAYDKKVYDYMSSSTSEALFYVGGGWGNVSFAGVSYFITYSLDYSNTSCGARLAYVFDAGAASELQTYDVTFNVNGGTAVPTQTIVEGNYATLPEAPQREGHQFDGWYLASDFSGEKFDFENTTINATTTINAKWLEKYTFTSEITSGSASAVNAIKGQAITVTITPTEGCVLPNAVTVKVAGTTITEYLYDDSTGQIVIPGEKVTGDIQLIAECPGAVFKLKLVITDGTYTSPSLGFKEAVDITITPREGHNLPTTVLVSIGGAEFTGFTYKEGKISIPSDAVTGDVTITVVCEEAPVEGSEKTDVIMINAIVGFVVVFLIAGGIVTGHLVATTGASVIMIISALVLSALGVIQFVW